MTLNILYLAHDLTDAAIRRRVMMLTHGGAQVTVAGFQRADNRLADDPGVTTIVLGTTADGRFAQRIGAVAAAWLAMKRKLAGVQRPEVIIGRNLEMLALAARASGLFGGSIPVVYECLDIHRLLLDEGVKGRMLRMAEAGFGRRARMLMTSSPAFIEHYFARRSRLKIPTMLVENKVLDLTDVPAAAPLTPRAPEEGRPWRIGWFGALRCRKSLSILTEFAERMDGRVQIVLRGRPAYGEFDDFDRQVERAPYVEFHGPYRNPEDLAAIYSDIQFVWTIDFFEEGLNSAWLLPNRLYEGALHGAIPIALKPTETGRFLDRRGLGLTLDAVTAETLTRQFDLMDRQRYEALFAKLSAADGSQWVAGAEDCRALVARLAGLKQTAAADHALHLSSSVAR